MSFAVASDGTLCSMGQCRFPDGRFKWMGNFTAVAFDIYDDIYLNGDAANNVFTAPLYDYPNGAVTLLAEGGTGGGISATLTVNAQAPGTVTDGYAYDAASRLTQTTLNAQPNENYGYDAVGNHTSDPRNTDYQYDNLNRLTSGNGASYQYDANGNRIKKTDASGETQYRYSAENQLIGITLPSGTTVQYDYDPFGRRIQKTITEPSAKQTVRRYVYSGANLAAELDGQNNPVSHFVHGPEIDAPIIMRRNGKVYNYHVDALGSIASITDSTGNVVQRYSYDAYGNLTYVQDPSFRQPFAYTGREWDEESGLYYYRARYYDAKVGQFIQQDPIGLAGGIDMRAYVDGDPINATDPLGLMINRKIKYTTESYEETGKELCNYVKNGGSAGPWPTSRYDRDKNPGDLNKRNAEHYLYANDIRQNWGGGVIAGIVATSGVTFHAGWKIIRSIPFVPLPTTPPSYQSFVWGIAGAWNPKQPSELNCSCPGK